MWSRQTVREMIHILIESPCYFGLDLKERYMLIMYLLGSFQPVEGQEV